MNDLAQFYLDQLKRIARRLEDNGHLFSADEQALIRMQAKAVEATVDRNMVIKLYSHNEDDI
jgi:hypothetical protein